MADWRTPIRLLLLGLAIGASGAARADDAPAANAGAANAGAAKAGAGTGTGAVTDNPGGSGPIVASPSVLPAIGRGAGVPDVRIGDLGGQLPSAKPPEPPGRAWTITPSIGLTEEYTTGGQGRGSGAVGRQFITTLQPGLVVSGDTTRLHGDLSYAPQILFYSRDGNQNQVNQNFQGRLLATVIPGTLFLDLRGAGAVQAITAGQAPTDLTTLSRADTSQTYSFSASPYAVHRFGPWGTGEIGGSIARTTQNALQESTSAVPLNALADSSNQNVTTTSGHLAFVTGEAFARYSGTALGQITDFAGTGVLRGAYRDIATLDNGYAITRNVTALATIGWERIHYSGSAPVDIDDAVWNVGMRLTPNADSSITVRYGHQDGLNSFSLDAAWQPTARTRIFARYSTGLTTQAELLQNALATSDLDALGNPVDHTTGAPLIAAGNFFGTQNSVYKTTIASLTGVLLLDRDRITAGVNSQTQDLISASSAVGLAQGSTSGVYGTLSWSHQLRPNLTSTLYGQYGTQSSDGPGLPPATRAALIAAGVGTNGLTTGDSQVLAVAASLSYALSPTLSGQLQYSYNQTFGGSPLAGVGNASQSIVLLSLTKSF